MGASCKTPSQAVTPKVEINADKQQQTQNNDNDRNICCCFGLCNPVVECQGMGMGQGQGKITGKQIAPIQFSDGGGDGQEGVRGSCMPKFCNMEIQEQEKEKQHELESAQRIFIKTGSTDQKQQPNIQTSPQFQKYTSVYSTSQIQQPQPNPQTPQDQTSTKRDIAQPPCQPPIQIVIRAKKSIISSYYNGNEAVLAKMPIPFQVIKLSLHSHIASGLQAYYPDFMRKFERKEEARNQLWRMLKNGTYTNVLENLHGIFITKDQFYEGYFVKNGDAYIPEQKGIFIDRQQVYKGQLKQGKANGQGTLYLRQLRHSYTGTWFQGSFIVGKHETPSYSYDGQFYNNVPSGLGELRIKQKQKNIVYRGKFVDGQFDDEEGIYRCDRYLYRGGFAGGSKYGRGVLEDFGRKVRLEGNWVNDKLIQLQSVTQL